MNKDINYLHFDITFNAKEIVLINQYFINLALDIKRSLLELDDNDILYKELSLKYFLIKSIISKTDEVISELYREIE